MRSNSCHIKMYSYITAFMWTAKKIIQCLHQDSQKNRCFQNLSHGHPNLLWLSTTSLFWVGSQVARGKITVDGIPSSYMTLQLFYRVLAFSTSFSFHPLPSCARVFQFGTLSFRMSFLTSSIQRIFGLPIGLLETEFQEYIAFTILILCILST